MKKLIAILVAVFIVATCSESTSTVAQETQDLENQVAIETKVVPDESRCKKPGVRKIKIKIKKGMIEVDPYKTDAELGDELRFEVIVTGNVESFVYVGGKEADDVWITANNGKGAEKFCVCVDETYEELKFPEEEKTFEYFVRIPGVGEIDPEVVVRR